MIKKFIILPSLAAAFALASATSQAAQQWTPWTKITTLYPHDSGELYIYLQDNSVNPGSCQYSTHRVEAANKSIDRIYATLMSAVAANLDVRLYISDCIGSYRKVRHVQVRPHAQN